MSMNYHTKIDLVEGGNIFRQGEYVSLAYTPRDDSGRVEDLAGKEIEVVIWGRKGIMYEGAASWDATDQLIRVTIRQLLEHGEFNIEFTATSSTDADYRKKFPSGQYDGKITIEPSADNMDLVGVKMTTVTQLRQEQESKQREFEGTITPQIQELKQRVEESTNLFNPHKESKGYNISGTDGSLVENPSYNTTELYKVEPLQKFSTKGFNNVAFQTENGAFLSRGNLVASGSTFGVPNNAYQMRLHYEVSTPYKVQLNAGDVLLVYEKGYTPKLKDITVDDGVITVEKLDGFLSGINNNQTSLVNIDGRLTSVTTTEGGQVINSMKFNYDARGFLLNTIEILDGKQITTTLNRDISGNVTSFTNNVAEVV